MVTQVTFTIDPQGEVQVSVQGASGKHCEDLTKPFENVLGRVESRTYKDEYFAQDHTEIDVSVEDNS